MSTLAGLALSASLALAAATAQPPPGPVLIGVWYGGGIRRPPDVAARPQDERDTWRRELRTIRALGFNSVVTWVSWPTAEPSRGQYRLEALEQLVALAGEAGLRVRVHVELDPAPDWARAYGSSLPSLAKLFEEVVAARAPVHDATAAAIDVGASTAAADLRLWGWAAIARGSRQVAFHAWPDLIDRDGRPTDRARTAGEFAGVITRNPALFAPLAPRQASAEAREPPIRVSGSAAEIHAVFLESRDALVLVAMNYAATPESVTLTFAPGTKQEFWQNMETGDMVTFRMAKDGPSLTHAFAPRDALVLMIRKTSPYDR